MILTINRNEVSLEVVPETATLADQDTRVLEMLDATLRANQVFQTLFPNATLTRVDVMTGIPATTQGRYYLRYSSTNGITEFWGQVSSRVRLDFKHGLVSAPLGTPEQMRA